MPHKSSLAARRYMQKYYLKYRDRIKARVKARYERKRDEITAANRERYAANPQIFIRKMAAYRRKVGSAKVLGWHRKANKKYRHGLKEEAHRAYGNKCQCCGETIPEFLTLDHVKNDGKEHREALGHSGRGHGFYLWLKRQGYPKEIVQLLCMNCNWAKGVFGKCPHKLQRGTKWLTIKLASH
jgi:hypothetical protein